MSAELTSNVNNRKQRSMTGPSHTGFNPHLPGFRHQFLAKALGATMWFFIFYRAREDGPKLLGLKHPWEGHDHGHGQGHHATDAHGEHH